MLAITCQYQTDYIYTYGILQYIVCNNIDNLKGGKNPNVTLMVPPLLKNFLVYMMSMLENCMQEHTLNFQPGSRLDLLTDSQSNVTSCGFRLD